MFEIFGPFAKPTPSMLPLLLALWPLVGTLACVVDAQRARTRALWVCVSGALAAAVALVVLARLPSDEQFVLGHVSVVARVGLLDLVLALGLDPLGAFASAVAFAVTAWLVFEQGPSARRRIALVCAMGVAVQLVVMADGAPMLVLAGGLASLLGAALGYVHAPAFVADRIGDAALVAASAIVFWALGGSWIGDQYVPELEPRVVVAAPEGAKAIAPFADDDDEVPRAPSRTLARNARATLSLTSLPGAAVLVDGTWLRGAGGALARAPFADAPIPAGPHTIRLHVGAGSDDFYIPRVNATENEHVDLAVRGATTTFREMQDDLVARDALGERPLRAAVVRRHFFGGLSAIGLALALISIAFAARVRLFPFAPSQDEPARALTMFAALVMASRFPLGDLSPRAATCIACALLVSGLIAGASAAQNKRGRDVLAGELAFACAGVMAGAPAIALLHGALATLLLSRERGLAPRLTGLVLFATRAAIAGALYALPFGALPTLLALVFTGLSSFVVVRQRSASASVLAFAIVALAFGLDSHVFGFAYGPLVAIALAPSFHVLTPTATCSVPLFGLVAATTIFGAIAPIPKLGKYSLEAILSAPSRAASAITSAAAAALFELESYAANALVIGDRIVRGLGAGLFVLDEVLSSLLARRVPLPSERVARLVLVPVALGAALLFAVPWLS